MIGKADNGENKKKTSTHCTPTVSACGLSYQTTVIEISNTLLKQFLLEIFFSNKYFPKKQMRGFIFF